MPHTPDLCQARGCVNQAAGALLLAYAEPDHIRLCMDHLQPLRRQVVGLLHELPRHHTTSVEVAHA